MKTNIISSLKRVFNYLLSKLTSIHPHPIIRIANLLFVAGLAYTYVSWMDVPYQKSNAIDYIWYMHDKVFIALLYFALLYYVKDEPLLKWEIFAVTMFCLWRIGWQIWEIVSPHAANSDSVQFLLCLVSISLFATLATWRIAVQLWHKNSPD